MEKVSLLRCRDYIYKVVRKPFVSVYFWMFGSLDKKFQIPKNTSLSNLNGEFEDQGSRKLKVEVKGWLRPSFSSKEKREINDKCRRPKKIR